MDYKYSKLHFNRKERSLIDTAITLGASESILDIMTQICSHPGGAMPVFNSDQMNCIIDGLLKNFSDEQIKLYTPIDKYNSPTFSEHQMKEIINGFEKGLKYEEVQLYAQNIDGNAKFRFEQMLRIKKFLLKANSEQIRQLKKFINDSELQFNDYSVFLYKNSPANIMRVCHSLYDMGCERDLVSGMLKSCNYESLKTFKYLTKCVDAFWFDINVVMKGRPLTIESAHKAVLNTIQYNRDLVDDEAEIIGKCLSYKISAEQIDFLTDKDNCFSVNEMECIANAFIDGISVETAREILKACYTWDGVRDPQLVYDLFDEATNIDISVKSSNDEIDNSLEEDER